MKNLHLKFTVILITLIITSTKITFSQGIMISDNTETVADASAMLEIQSTSKGLLIPRLTTAQRNNLTSYAKEGLLVYDVTVGSFFIYGKTNSGILGWNDLSTPSGIWETSDSKVFLASRYTNLGIGTNEPSKKLVIQADNETDTLMEILDVNGKPLMILTPQLTKFYFNESAKGVAGGFAIGRYATAKLTNDTALFIVTPDSTRVYTAASGAKGIAGGFAVGRYATAKGENAKKYFYTGIDSTRVYTDGSSKKGTAGGFAVGRYATAKTGNSGNYMYMLPDNYFIGHGAGKLINSGIYNLYFGYQSGTSDTAGSNNVFVGHQTGYSNKIGKYNIFLGNKAGYHNIGSASFEEEGSRNIFMGYSAGYTNKWGYNNIYIGDSAGYSTEYAHDNIFIGNSAGYHTEADDYIYGSQNVFIGNSAGYQNREGLYNVYIGYETGYSNFNGSGNTFIGGASGKENNSRDNTFIGGAAFYKNTAGKENTSLGAYTGNNNIIGTGNVFLGYKAGYDEAGSNRLYIENSVANNTAALIYGEFDNDVLRFNANVGIGLYPTEKLQVSGNVYASGGDFYAASSNGVINCGGGIMNASINVIADNITNLNSVNGDEDLYIQGDLEVDGITYKVGNSAWDIQSDKRLKKDIREYKDGLNQILQINPVYFRYNDKAGVADSKKEYVGIIAQDIKDVAPYTVELTPFKKTEIEDENGNIKEVKWDGTEYYTFNPSALTYMLINGMKEQQVQIEKQEIKSQNQNKEIEQLKQQIQELKDLIK